jgi:hypothetical protein
MTYDYRRGIIFMLRVLLVLVMCSVLLISCGMVEESSSQNSTGEQNDTSQENPSKDKSKKANAAPLTAQEFEKLYSDPQKYEGRKVEFYAKIFIPVERDDNGTYIQAYADPKNSEKNTLIAIRDPNLDVKQDDIIHIQGVVEGVHEGQNAFGATLTLPVVVTDKVEKSDWVTAFSPAIKTVELSTPVDQHGYIVDVKKIEFAEDETRVYVSVTNNSNENITFWRHTSKIVQGSKQYEPEFNFNVEYPEVNSDILPGVTSEGIITFAPLDVDAGELTLYLEGTSDNWDIDIKPFVVNSTW